MFCFLITALFVRDELMHDKWHENSERIYFPKIVMNRGAGVKFSLFPTLLIGDALKKESSGVEDVVNISFDEAAEFNLNDNWFETKAFYRTQPSLFNVFDFDLKYGNKTTALSEPDNVILSSELAEKYFPNKNPVGEIIEFKKKGMLKVSGVLMPIPPNSHLNFEMLAPINMEEPPYNYYKNNWNTGVGLNYILLKEGYTVEKLGADVKRILAPHMNTSKGNQIVENASYADSYVYEAFSEAYLNGNTMRSDSKNIFGGQTKYIYIFSLVGGLILIVACFNYINLTTARSFARSKDIGIRKVIGASKARLVASQMGETLLVSFIALVVAIIGLELLLPAVNNLIGKELSLNIIQNPDILILPIVLLLLVVVLSGIYPAVTLSTFNISDIMKGSNPKSRSNIFRKSLVVLQFLICCGLLTGALIIRGQAKYMVNIDLGYNQENIYSVNLLEVGLTKYRELRTAIEAIPSIEKVSGSPLPRLDGAVFLDVGEGEEKVSITAFYGEADKDFNEILGLEVLQGTDFSTLTESELQDAVLINEKTVKTLGWDDPVGQELGKGMRVVGVVKDFHYSSVRNEIGAAMIKYGDDIRNIQFSFRQRDKAAVEAQVASVFKDFGIDKPVEMKEIESFFSESYTKEEKLVGIFDVLTGLLMVIAFLGLFALSTFENQLREKEIGIRKLPWVQVICNW